MKISIVIFVMLFIVSHVFAAEFTPTTLTLDALDILQYDFDGTVDLLGVPTLIDSFGLWFGIWEPGMGTSEVMAAPGDSGGPTFLTGKIIVITSYGVSLPFTDLDGFQNSSIGEFGGDTRVAMYAGFIDGIINPIPIPSAVWLFGSGLICLLGIRRKSNS